MISTNRLLIGPQAVRAAARRGELAQWAAAATESERRQLTGAVYEIALPLVFTGLTRRLEQQRGHAGCAASLRGLTDDCFDRFQDDLEAVVVDVLNRATMPVENLDMWIRRRMHAATVDAHRRRRGERGAMQRPRLPGWLREALGDDRWLTVLATEMLVWVGVPVSAGTGLWPLDSWAQRRAVLTRDWRGSDTATVAREVEEVQRAMRRRPDWYASYVEGPLGRKNPPVVPAPRGDADRTPEPAPLPLVERHEADDARLRALAAIAVEEIEAGIARGGAPGAVVAKALQTAFDGDSGARDLERVPSAAVADDERAATLVNDPAVIDRVVANVLSILGGAEADDEPAGQRAPKTCPEPGVSTSRPARVDDDVLAVAHARLARGQSVTVIARDLGIGRSTLYRALQPAEPADGD